MITETHHQYARLLLECGINLQPGQCLAIQGDPIHYPFFEILAEDAYRRGARYVDIRPRSARVIRSRLTHSSGEDLTYVPGDVERRIEVQIDEAWTNLFFEGLAEPDLLQDVDKAKQAIATKRMTEINQPLTQSRIEGHVRWCIASLPTPGWAAKVFGEPASPELTTRLWKELQAILRLDTEDPVHTWRNLAAVLGTRAEKLTAAQLTSLHFQGPGTDLRVGLIPGALWQGGGNRISAASAFPFMPNLPTEEVYTTPDWRLTEGRARVTRPVKVLGSAVEGAWFEFEAGRVTAYGADRGQENLDAYFAIHHQANALGEIALVDTSSPIFQSGLVFDSILLDENAACHMALGFALTSVIPNAKGLSEEELLAQGVNQTLVHTDFMIGSEEINVTAQNGQGEEIPIIQDGRFGSDFA